jgi:aspartyl-tRNA(Asn)/glutamyl-tRNA(Gln) amidotransferase subunit A
MQKGRPATAGSKILENFIAPFDAEVVTRLNGETKRVKLAEFGVGDPGALPDDAPLLVNDVFGHVRRRASEQGLCYIRPAYGTVSRYGLIPTAASMDQIGIVCKNPDEGFALLSVIAGSPKNSIPPGGGEQRLPLSEHVQEQVLNILVCAEISGNLSRYDGIKFGYRTASYKGLDELCANTRTEALSPGDKFAVIMGAYVLSQENYERYYLKAMKIRRLIKESLRFDEYDVLVLPVSSPLAVLCGLPSLTFGDTQLVANVKNENALWAAWEEYNS